MFGAHRSLSAVVSAYECTQRHFNEGCFMLLETTGDDKCWKPIRIQFLEKYFSENMNCVKLFKNGPSKICGRQSLKTFTF